VAVKRVIGPVVQRYARPHRRVICLMKQPKPSHRSNVRQRSSDKQRELIVTLAYLGRFRRLVKGHPDVADKVHSVSAL
jgi:hypothetical protein